MIKRSGLLCNGLPIDSYTFGKLFNEGYYFNLNADSNYDFLEINSDKFIALIEYSKDYHTEDFIEVCASYINSDNSFIVFNVGQAEYDDYLQELRPLFDISYFDSNSNLLASIRFRCGDLYNHECFGLIFNKLIYYMQNNYFDFNNISTLLNDNKFLDGIIYTYKIGDYSYCLDFDNGNFSLSLNKNDKRNISFDKDRLGNYRFDSRYDYKALNAWQTNSGSGLFFCFDDFMKNPYGINLEFSYDSDSNNLIYSLKNKNDNENDNENVYRIDCSLEESLDYIIGFLESFDVGISDDGLRRFIGFNYDSNGNINSDYPWKIMKPKSFDDVSAILGNTSGINKNHVRALK